MKRKVGRPRKPEQPETQLPLPLQIPEQSERAILTSVLLRLLQMTDQLNSSEKNFNSLLNQIRQTVTDQNGINRELAQRVQGNEIRLSKIESETYLAPSPEMNGTLTPQAGPRPPPQAA